MGLFGCKKGVLVVDTSAVLKAKGVRGRAAPRQQLQILRSLSRLAQREKLKVTAVLVGEPLDKAPHNKVFEDVRVRYSKSDETLSRELMAALKQAGSAGVLVTEDVPLETRVLRSGGNTLRVSTFRKMLDDGNEPFETRDGNNGGGRDKNRDGNRDGNRPPRNRRDRGPRRNGGGQRPPQQRPGPAEPERQSDDNDTISQMIDLVE